MNSSGETNNPETNEKQTVRKGVREMAATDVGIDLGTASILVYVRGKGVVLKEPSVVAYDRDTNKIKAIGEEARLMLGRTPGNIIAVRPMRKGVISDYTVTEKMLKYFINKAVGKRSLRNPASASACRAEPRKLRKKQWKTPPTRREPERYTSLRSRSRRPSEPESIYPGLRQYDRGHRWRNLGYRGDLPGRHGGEHLDQGGRR